MKANTWRILHASESIARLQQTLKYNSSAVHTQELTLFSHIRFTIDIPSNLSAIAIDC